MNVKFKRKVNLLADVCADTSVAEILYGFVEDSRTEQKVTLFGFDHDLSRKFIPIVSNATAINLPNCTIIDQLNRTPSLFV